MLIFWSGLIKIFPTVSLPTTTDIPVDNADLPLNFREKFSDGVANFQQRVLVFNFDIRDSVQLVSYSDKCQQLEELVTCRLTFFLYKNVATNLAHSSLHSRSWLINSLLCLLYRKMSWKKNLSQKRPALTDYARGSCSFPRKLEEDGTFSLKANRLWALCFSIKWTGPILPITHNIYKTVLMCAQKTISNEGEGYRGYRGSPGRQKTAGLNLKARDKAWRRYYLKDVDHFLILSGKKQAF